MIIRTIIVVRICMMILVISCSPQVSAAEVFRSRNAGFSFLTLPTSATANGMGGATIADVENGSAPMNPGYLGILHSKKNLNVSLPYTTNWGPELGPDVNLKAWGISFGHNFPHRNDVNLFISYYHKQSDYNVARFVADPLRNTLTGKEVTFVAVEEVDALSFGIGMKKRIRFGIGGTIKKLQESLSEFLLQPDFGSGFSAKSNYAFDFGGVLQAPLISSQNRLSDLNVSLAYAYNNLGSKANLLSGTQFEVNLPRVERLSVAVDGTYRFHSRVVVSGKVALERENDKVGNLEPIYRRGIEAGVNNALFVRIGKFNRGFDNSDISTWGAGLRLRGLLDWILNEHSTESSNTDKLKSFARRIDLRIDYAHYSGDILSGTEFLQTTFSF
jgi:hypothetical protein